MGADQRHTAVACLKRLSCAKQQSVQAPLIMTLIITSNVSSGHAEREIASFCIELARVCAAAVNAAKRQNRSQWPTKDLIHFSFHLVSPGLLLHCPFLLLLLLTCVWSLWPPCRSQGTQPACEMARSTTHCQA